MRNPLKKMGCAFLLTGFGQEVLQKKKASVDLWLKEIAPTTALRKWFAHDPKKSTEFRKKYLQELKYNEEQVSLLKERSKKGTVTLVYGAKDEEHNEAHVLEELLNLNRIKNEKDINRT